MKRIFASLALLVLIVAGVLFSINNSKSPGQDSNKLQIVATHYPLYDFAQNVGGNRVQVHNMTPAGAEPHEYEPSAKALADAQRADVFLYNGGGLEPWTSSFLHDFKHVAVQASKGIDLRGSQGAHHEEEDADHHEHVQDPHFWLDPVLAQTIVNNIRDGLVRADPANKAFYTQNANTYNAKLIQLDADFRTELASCDLRTVISSHDAFSYLGQRYNIHIESIAGISPEEEPSAAKLAELSHLVRNQGIRYVFFEHLVSPRLADTIAAETGAKTLVFDPIEGLTNEDQKQGKNYLSIQRENLANLRTALSCR